MAKPLILLVTLLLPSVFAVYGVDVSQLFSTGTWQCIVGQGFTFSMIRGYMSNGQVDPNVVQSIQNARAAGMQYVDVYLFPCVPCGNPAGQANQLVNAIAGQNYGMIWVDIEIYAWSGSQIANQGFITTMVNQLKALGQNVGIYTNYYMWQSIVGLGWTGVSNNGLWYANYDGNPSFNGFVPFGGWQYPNIKQYQGDVNVCGANVDLNWY